jgi:hypothetical protein
MFHSRLQEICLLLQLKSEFSMFWDLSYMTEKLFTSWQKESWQNFEETSGYVRPDRSTSGPTP